MPRARRAAICIALGLLTTIAVSWAIAAWMPQTDWRWRSINDDRTYTNGWVIETEHRTIGAVRRSWVLEIPGLQQRSRFWNVIPRNKYAEKMDPDISADDIGTWGHLPRVQQRIDAGMIDGFDHATGWPMLASWYSLSVPPTDGQPLVLDGAIPIHGCNTGTAAFVASKARALPLHPIWRGIAVNTAFYAAMWIVLLNIVASTRRRLRRRRGSCDQCGYPLTGLPAGSACPECGRPISGVPDASHDTRAR